MTKTKKRAKRRKLTQEERARLESYAKEHGGHFQTAIKLGVWPETLSRNINGHTAPSPMLRKKLLGIGVVAEL